MGEELEADVESLPPSTRKPPWSWAFGLSLHFSTLVTALEKLCSSFVQPCGATTCFVSVALVEET